MRRIILSAVALLTACACWAQTSGDATQLGGQVRLQWTGQQTSSAGPLAQADALETELRASGHGLTGIATLQQQRMEGRATASRAWVNELYASHDGGAWQFSVGKKIVAWDVGYGFRPNDMVQQEERRTLVSSTAEGRPLLMAEHFSASTAWSWVWVNPTASTDAMGAKEPVLAVRVYQRDGAVDWHGFARVGAHTGASVGAAAAWVASDAMELHASANYHHRTDSKALIGATWTNQSQLSLLTEAWWDGSAPSMLRNNVYLRLCWQHEAWQPALDLLYTPADQGRVWTASLNWQGDQVQLQGGLRAHNGPANAVLMQLPVRGLAYVATTWTF
jgi:hypothetical protein